MRHVLSVLVVAGLVASPAAATVIFNSGVEHFGTTSSTPPIQWGNTAPDGWQQDSASGWSRRLDSGQWDTSGNGRSANFDTNVNTGLSATYISFNTTPGNIYTFSGDYAYGSNSNTTPLTGNFSFAVVDGNYGAPYNKNSSGIWANAPTPTGTNVAMPFSVSGVAAGTRMTLIMRVENPTTPQAGKEMHYNWDRISATEVVPEPAAAWLCLVGIMFLSRRRPH